MNPSPRSLANPVFIGFAGRIGSGKTTAAQYLAARYGFQYIRYSQVLRDWISPRESEKSRLQEIGWEVMNGGMQLELNLHLISRLDQTHSAAIDGLRHEIDYRSLATAFAPSFSLIFLRSSESCRFERQRHRFVDFASFKSTDNQTVESRIDELEPLAALTIFNEGLLEQLHHQLDGWLKKH